MLKSWIEPLLLVLYMCISNLGLSFCTKKMILEGLRLSGSCRNTPFWVNIYLFLFSASWKDYLATPWHGRVFIDGIRSDF
ncbi:hypothetical protein VNO78_34943 [Psophocarpus tetragonolobus]|uniref:Uncharacterized protein n=1 Tax=Psophocarpus tetragonolobus TaxID=3891 RepID=A0AAN9NNG7_PSOTE